MIDFLIKYNAKKGFIPFSFLLFYIATRLISVHYFDIDQKKIELVKECQQNLLIQEKEILSFLEPIKDLTKVTSAESGMLKNPFFVFKGDSLIHYNNHKAFLDKSLFDLEKNNFQLWLGRNGYYSAYRKDVEDHIAIVLIPIQRRYSIKNQYFYSKLVLNKRANAEVNICLDKDVKHKIYNGKGSFLFGVDNIVFKDADAWWEHLSLLFAVLFLISILWLFYSTLKYLDQKKYNYWIIFSLIILLIPLRFVCVYFKFPIVFYELELFGPGYFASSFLWPSLGDAFINITLLIFIFWIVFRLFGSYLFEKFTSAKFLLFLIFFFVSFEWLSFFVSSLILDSNIDFSINNFFEFDVINVFLIFTLSVTIILYYLFYKQMECIMEKAVKEQKYLLLIISVFGFLWVIGAHYVKNVEYSFEPSFMTYVKLFPGLGALFLIYNTFYIKRFSFINKAFYFISFFSVFFSLVILHAKSLKNEDQKSLTIQKIAEGRNPLLEYQIQEALSRIQENDPLFDDYMSTSLKFDDLLIYLNKEYNKDAMSSLVFEGINIDSDLDFMSQMDTISFEEHRLFWGRDSNLLSTYIVEIKPSNYDANLYLKLRSKEVNRAKSLLQWVENKSRLEINHKLSQYSYALYYEGRLKKTYGDINMPKVLNVNDLKVGYERYFNWNNKAFLCYQISESHAVVFYSDKYGFKDLVSVFSYLFSFLFFESVLLFILLYIIFYILFKGQFLKFDFPRMNLLLRNKIHFLSITVLMMSFILVGWNTMLNVQKEFEKYHQKRMDRKVGSLMRYLSFIQEEISVDLNVSEIAKTMNQLSKANAININLFNKNGKLIYTSQNEVYTKGLVGKRMPANINTHFEQSSDQRYIVKEAIGAYQFYSAYFPLFNSINQRIGMVNVPYYASMKEKESEVSSLLLNLNNLYVVLFFGISLLTSFFTYRISQSLTMINNNLKEFKIGKKNPRIEWSSNDEIGALVKEYNKMSKKLEKSVQQLAKSERESAWREMARQIAHEIKNPLTPMKLSIQHLSRAVKDEDADIDALLKKVSRTMIEQIDHLSHIASEFSSFARMPQANNELLNLAKECETLITLFEKDVKIELDIQTTGDFPAVYMDKSYLIRVLTNLLKNALQAVEEKENPIIEVTLTETESTYLINVKDNGVGVEEGMKEKIFEPNFTTKSSGTGLGLAMCRSIVLSCDGDIYLDELYEEGASFFVELPKYREK